MEPILLVCLLIPVVALVVTVRVRRSREILDSWVASNGYRLVSSRFCWFWRGPFFLRSSEGQSVFQVTVMDDTGRKRNGWVRCGGFFFGVFKDKADVRWDQ